ncbi:MAG: hypothetical protein H6Q26_3120, partial [Bacteroidetes bacterium]|nr:hypothetical protein [Bacteroidota bacterium]
PAAAAASHNVADLLPWQQGCVPAADHTWLKRNSGDGNEPLLTVYSS